MARAAVKKNSSSLSLKKKVFAVLNNAVIKGIYRSIAVTVIILLISRYVTSNSVLPSYFDTKILVETCRSKFCEPALKLVYDISNFISIISLSMIGGFIFLLREKSAISSSAKLTSCILGIMFSVIAILISYTLAVDLAAQLFIGAPNLNIISDRLIWEAGFAFLSTMVLVFVALTTNWEASR